MPKVLNLDVLAPKEVRELHMAGKVYTVKEMSVEDFIEASRMAEAMEGVTSFAEQMEASIKLIKRSIPEIDEEFLKRLNMEQLAAVSKFVRGEEIVESTEGGAGNE